MRRMTLAVLLIVSFAVPAYSKPFYKNWKFWAGEAVIAGALVADYHSTARNGAIGETNHFLIGRNPSSGRMAGVGVAAFVWYSGLNIAAQSVSQNDPNKYWRFAGYASVPATVFAVHVPAAIHNYHIAPYHFPSQSPAIPCMVNCK